MTIPLQAELETSSMEKDKGSAPEKLGKSAPHSHQISSSSVLHSKVLETVRLRSNKVTCTAQCSLNPCKGVLLLRALWRSVCRLGSKLLFTLLPQHGLLPFTSSNFGILRCFVSSRLVGKVGTKQRGAPLLYLGERIRWLPLTTFRTHGVTASSLASEASPELLMPLKVELCRAATGTLIAATAGSRLLQAHSAPTSDKAGWLQCDPGVALQSLAPLLQARARPRSSMQAPMPGLQEGQQLATGISDIPQL